MLWFITPAWRRYALSAVCFEQRRRAIESLRKGGLDAQCVVVADDHNLELARSAGFDTLKRDNRWLGRKFNDGIEYALASGAEWIVPIGSDSWIDPEYLRDLRAGVPRTGRHYAIVEADRMLVVAIRLVGPHVIPREAFERCGPRPADERIRRGFDRSLMDAIGPQDWEEADFHDLQYIGFRGERHITTYSKVKLAYGGIEVLDPWSELATAYEEDLVAAARKAMAGIRRPMSYGRLDAWSVRDKILTLIDRFRR